MPTQPVGLSVVVAVAVLVSAVVRPYVSVDGLAAISVSGPLLLATAIGGAVIAAAVIFSRYLSGALLAVGVASTTVVAYWTSVLHGLFGVGEVAGGWPGIVAETAENAAVVEGAMAATMLWPQRNPNRPSTTVRDKRVMRPPWAIGAPFATSVPSPARDPVLPGRTGP